MIVQSKYGRKSSVLGQSASYPAFPADGQDSAIFEVGFGTLRLAYSLGIVGAPETEGVRRVGNSSIVNARRITVMFYNAVVCSAAAGEG
jgi:hypothetical protein